MANRWHTANRNTPATQARRRKYAGREHRDAVTIGKRRMERDGHLPCWRCGTLIPRGTPWHVGHDDTNVDLIRGYEHATCNLRAAARKGNRVARARTATLRPVRRRPLL